MNIRPGSLFSEFDSRSLSRGQDIYQADDVLSWNTMEAPRKGLLLVGQVRSQSNSKVTYQSSLAFDKNGSFSLVTCSCPVGGYCKHDVALFLSFLERLKAGDAVDASFSFKASGRKAPRKRVSVDDYLKGRSRRVTEYDEEDEEYQEDYDDYDDQEDADEYEAEGNDFGRAEVGRLSGSFRLKSPPGSDVPARFAPGAPASGIKDESAPIAKARKPLANPLKEAARPRIEKLAFPAGEAGMATDLVSALSLALGLGKDVAAAGRTPADLDRWALAFAVGPLPDSGRTPVLVFWKALRYLKKDGSEGRLARWRPNAALEPIPAADLPFLARFSSNDDECIPLVEVMDLLAISRPEDMNIASGRPDNSGVPCTVLSFSALSLAFKPVSWQAFFKRVGFSLSFRLEELGSPSERTDGGNDPGHSQWFSARGRGGALATTGGGHLAVLSPSLGFLAISKDRNLGLAPLAALVNLERELSHADLSALAVIERALPDPKPLRMEPIPTSVELRKVSPGAQLRITRKFELGRMRLVARLVFDYEGRFFDPQWQSPFGTLGGSIPPAMEDVSLEGSLVVVRLRDREREDRILRMVVELLSPSVDRTLARSPAMGAPGVFPIALEEGRILLELAPSLLDAGLTLRYEDEEYEGLGRASAGVRLESRGGWFEARIVLGEGQDAELEVADPAVLFERGFAKVGSKLIILSPEDRSALELLMDRWDAASGRMKIRAEDFGRLELAAGLADKAGRELLAERLALGRALASAFSTAGKGMDVAGGWRIPEEPLPAQLCAQLRPYQKEGYDRLCFMYSHGLSALLADDMGLGKTVQALALMARLKEKGELGKVLIVAPLTLLSNWEAEAARFVPAFSVRKHHGTGRASAFEEYGRADIVLTTYQTLRADLELFETVDFGFLALDEAQTIKNPDAAAFGAVKSIRAAKRLSITGTPVENRPLELWAQFDLIAPGLLDDRHKFERRFSRPISRGGEEAAKAASHLRTLAAPFIIRRKKEEVLKDLPPKEEILRKLEAGPKQAALYEKIRAEAEKRIRGSLREKGAKRSAITVFEALLRLRQAAIHPGLIDKSYEKAGSIKFEFLESSLEELVAEGHRVLIFSQFVEVLKRVEALMKKMKIAYEYLDGSTRDRKGAIERFKKGDASAFLLSLKAGGLGVNLPEADYVILLDPWWNPAVESQAVDRAHRIGQLRPVTVLKPLVEGTVEEKILELQERKKALVQDLISDSGGFYASLSEDEILRLFT